MRNGSNGVLQAFSLGGENREQAQLEKSTRDEQSRLAKKKPVNQLPCPLLFDSRYKNTKSAQVVREKFKLSRSIIIAVIYAVLCRTECFYTKDKWISGCGLGATSVMELQRW